MKPIRKKQRRITSRGFSLIEAIITLVITAIIVSAAAVLYFQNSQVATAHIALASLRANLRFAADVIEADLRHVGGLMYVPSVTAPPGQPPTPTVQYGTNSFAVQLVRGTNSGTLTQYTNAPTNLSYYGSYASDSTDTFQLMIPELLSGTVLQQAASGTGPLQVNYTTAVNANDWCAISDRSIVNPTTGGTGIFELFKASAISNTGNQTTSITSATTLSTTYAPGAQLMKFHYLIYSVKGSGSPDDFFRLVRKDMLTGSGNPVEEVVADGVEDIQICFGLDTDFDESPDDWTHGSTSSLAMLDTLAVQLKAVRITLVGISPVIAPIVAGAETNPSAFSDTTYNRPKAEDRNPAHDPDNVARFRDVYTRVIYLRNMR